MSTATSILSQIPHRNLAPISNSIVNHRSSAKSPTESILLGNLRLFPVFCHKTKGTEWDSNLANLEENEKTSIGRKDDEGLLGKNFSTQTKMMGLADEPEGTYHFMGLFLNNFTLWISSALYSTFEDWL